jgi:GntR family transcriptional repressor for pyruvate dehydrogenase complex
MPSLHSPARLKPIRSQSLVDGAVSALRRLILGGKFGAEGLLPSQGALAIELGISRPVVREAMRMLQSQGLVEVKQGKRPRVKPAGTQVLVESLGTLLERSDASLLDLLEVRRPLETEIAALAAERARAEDIARLRAAIEAQRSARRLEEQVDADVAFHASLARAAGNPIFAALLETLANLLRESRRRTILESGVEVPIDHHQRILAAVERRDPEGARAEMVRHLEMARGDLVRAGEKTEGAEKRQLPAGRRAAEGRQP